MMVMRDEMNCPMAETINKKSDQNLQEIYASGGEYDTRPVNRIHKLRLTLCDP